MHYNGAGAWLKPVESIQDNALIISVFVPSELATCSMMQDRTPQRNRFSCSTLTVAMSASQARRHVS
jgi:hypothetical protein